MIYIKLIAEMLGTFTLIGVILSVGQTIPIAIALAAAIYHFGKPTGGHFNPAVSFVMLLKGKITLVEYVMYTIAQLVGGYLALMWVNLEHTA
jgi:glycerol uptake facilitator-like aquaporin